MLKLKSLVPIVIFCLIAGSGFSQGNYQLSGSIANAKEPQVLVVIYKTFLNQEQEVITKPLQDGKFDVTLTLERNYMISLIYGAMRIPLYTQPGGNLHIEFADNGTGLNINLSGEGAEENSFVQKFFQKYAMDYNDSSMNAKMLSSTIDAFEGIIFKQHKEELDFYNKDSDKQKFSKEFSSFMESQINYHYWHQLYAYPIVNANSSTKILTVNPIPDVMLENFNPNSVNNEPALIADSYQNFLKYYIIYATSKTNGFNKFKDPSQSADRKMSVAREKLNGIQYQYWLTRFAVDECANVSPFIAKKIVSNLKEIDPNSKYVKIAEQACQGALAGNLTAQTGNQPVVQVQEQQQSNELDLVDVNGKPVQLSDFKGKVVYIDFWASWCGPCRMMMPYSKQLPGKLTDKQKKQIVFLYISIDGSSDAWKKGIQDMGIEGVNVNSPGNWGSKACHYFQINSIPRYMIMNKKGEIVDYNAKRPSDPNVLGELINLTAD